MCNYLFPVTQSPSAVTQLDHFDADLVTLYWLTSSPVWNHLYSFYWGDKILKISVLSRTSVRMRIQNKLQLKMQGPQKSNPPSTIIVRWIHVYALPCLFLWALKISKCTSGNLVSACEIINFLTTRKGAAFSVLYRLWHKTRVFSEPHAWELHDSQGCAAMPSPGLQAEGQNNQPCT